MAQTYTRQSSFADGDTITAALFNNEYNQLVNAFSYSSTSDSTTGHRHDGTAGQGGNIYRIGDLDFFNKVEIDTTNNRIGLYVQVSSGAVEQIRLQDGALLPVTDSDIDLGTTSLRFKDTYTDTITTTGNVAVGGNLTVTGTTTFNGGTLTLGDSAADNVVFGADVDSNIIPDDDGAYDLGSSTQEWRDLYIDGTAHIDTLDVDVNATIAGTLGVTGVLTGTSLDISGDIDVDGTTNLDVVDIDGAVDMATTLAVAGNVDFNGDLDVDGTTNLDVVDIDGAVDMATTLTVGGEITAASLDISGNVDIDGTLETDALSINGTAVTASAADINLIDGVTNGTVIASKAIITDSNKDITGGRNITISGEIDAATLDISGNADIDGTLEADAITIGGVTLAETISDTVGAMVTSNTESGITVAYQDADNTLDFTVGTLNQDTTGLAATATALATARTIHGVSFDGTANIDLTEVVQDTVGAMVSSNTESGITVAYQDGDGTLDFTVGTLNQNTTGSAATLTTARTIGGTSFDGSANIAVALAAEATTLETARTIGGVSFDGSANINLPGVNAAGNQATTGNAATATLAATTTVTDSTANTNFPIVFHNESNGLLDDTGALRYNPSTGELLVPKLTVAGTTTQVDTVTMEASNAIIFEGATADAHETTLSVVDPTADRTISLPNATGTLSLITGTETLTNKTLTAPTLTGTTVVASLDISGDIDVDGTTNLDVVDIDGAVAMATSLTIGGTSPRSNYALDVRSSGGNGLNIQAGDESADVVLAVGSTSTADKFTITSGGAVTTTGVITANAGVVVDNFTLDGTTLALSSGAMTISGADDLTLDFESDINIDANGGDIRLKDNGAVFGVFSSTNNDLNISTTASDKDIVFKGNDSDGSNPITALTLDMSAAGAATFNAGVTALTLNTTSSITSGTGITAGGEVSIAPSSGTAKLRLTSQGTGSEVFTVNGQIPGVANGGFSIRNETDSRNDLFIDAAGTVNIPGVFNALGGAVFNEASADVDFRVENNTLTHAFYVSGGNTTSVIGINQANPAAMLDIVTVSTAGAEVIRLKQPSSSETYQIQMGVSGATNDGLVLRNTESTGMLQQWRADEVVINDDSVDRDFRVESNGNTHMLFVDGGNNVVSVGGTPVETSDHFEVLSSDTTTNLRVRNTNAGSAAPSLIFDKSSGSPADDDEIGLLNFVGQDSANNAEVYAQITGIAADVTAGTEDGTLTFGTKVAGTFATRMSIVNGGTILSGDTSINRGNQTSGELLLGGTTDGGFVDFDGTNVQLNTQRDPNTGTFINTSKSHASMTMSGANGASSVKFGTAAANNTTATERLVIGSTEMVVNDASNDYDFRVESNGNANMLFVDGGNNAVGIGESAPASFGTLVVSASNPFIVAKSSSTSNAGYSMLVNGGSNGVGAISTDDGGHMTFDTGATGSAQVEKMRIQPDGAVILKPSGITTGLRLQGRSSDNNFFIQWNNNDGSTNYGSIGSVSATPGLQYSADDHKFVNQATNSPFLQMNSSGTVFNEGSQDRDFRVESNDNANMLFVDGGANHVNIGTSTDHGGTLNVATTDNSVNLVLACTDTDGNEGPILDFTRDAGNVPTDGDIMGRIRFRNDDTNLDMTNYVELTTVASDVSNGTEDGQLQFNIMDNGTFRNFAHMTGTTGTVFNEDSNDLDFRVESNGNTHMLFVDGGNNAVHIGGLASEGAGAQFNISNGSAETIEYFVGSGSNTNVIQAFNRSSSVYTKIDTRASEHLFRISTAEVLNVTSGGVVINEDSGDRDFRVESNDTTHMLFVDGGNNKVKIGTSSTLYSGGETMSVQCGSSQGIGIVTSGAAAQLLGLYNAASSGTRYYIRFAANSGGDEVGKITSDGSNITYATSSDARLKDVTGIARGLEVINELNPVAYNWKSSGKADEGLIAQEVQKIVPNAVVEGEEDEMYCMDYSKLVVHLVAGMKEQQELITTLQAEVALLKEK